MQATLSRFPRIWLITTLLGATILAARLPGEESLQDVFRQPPDEAKPRGYWVWPHGNFDCQVIRDELAQFKSKGLGGVDIFDLGVLDRDDVIPPGPGFLSPQQVDGIAFALDEAQRLGLKMGLIVSSSWNAGGTWTPPEFASMNLVAWRDEVTGPIRYERQLPLPELPEKFRKQYGSFPLDPPKDEQGRPRYRKDVAVLACPLDADGRVSDSTKVLRLDDRVDTDGKLVHEFPAGRWLVLRAVLVNFGQRLWLPSDRSQGLTMDHFSREATRHHFRTVIDRLEARTGPLKNTSLERLYLASYEANADVKWTPGFEESFVRLNGYQIGPFLPALFGVVVGDEDTTARFLYDYRRTVSELFVDNLYREASRICHDHGLQLCSEAGGPGAPLHDVPTEDLKALGAVDVMRGEFWNGKTDQLTPDGFEELQVVKPIASAAHIYGRQLVEMESFTSHISWNEGVDIFRPLADRAFCEGMTRVVYHTMSHNLPEAGHPGWTYQAGTHISTNQTWWPLSDQLHAYLARCSALLMQGHFVADAACYYGNSIPNFAVPKHIRPGLTYGYDYDDLNTQVLLRATVDQGGRIVLPSGMSYAILMLPENDRRMDLAVLQHLEKLVGQGAIVVGHRPEQIYGLRGYPAEEQALRELAGKLWAKSPAPSAGKDQLRGRFVDDRPAHEVLRRLGVGPDCDVIPGELRPSLDWIHRRTETADIYFLRNTRPEPLHGEVVFRVHHKQPELWNPVDGSMSRAAAFIDDKDGIHLPLQLNGHESTFVVFTPFENEPPHLVSVRYGDKPLFPRRAPDAPGFSAVAVGDGQMHFHGAEPGRYELHWSSGKTQTIDVLPDPAELPVSGPWQVRFPFGWDVPVLQPFTELTSWTDSSDPATRAFSGRAVYTTKFDLPAGIPASEGQVILDLGEVREIARVYVNGHDAGISTFAPHLLDVTRLVRTGENSLEVEVANTWLNRLIADDRLPPEERKTHTNLAGPVGGKRWRDLEPRRSGLLGPVRLRFPTAVVLSR